MRYLERIVHYLYLENIAMHASVSSLVSQVAATVAAEKVAVEKLVTVSAHVDALSAQVADLQSKLTVASSLAPEEDAALTQAAKDLADSAEKLPK